MDTGLIASVYSFRVKQSAASASSRRNSLEASASTSGCSFSSPQPPARASWDQITLNTQGKLWLSSLDNDEMLYLRVNTFSRAIMPRSTMWRVSLNEVLISTSMGSYWLLRLLGTAEDIEKLDTILRRSCKYLITPDATITNPSQVHEETQVEYGRESRANPLGFEDGSHSQGQRSQLADAVDTTQPGLSFSPTLNESTFGTEQSLIYPETENRCRSIVSSPTTLHEPQQTLKENLKRFSLDETINTMTDDSGSEADLESPRNKALTASPCLTSPETDTHDFETPSFPKPAAESSSPKMFDAHSDSRDTTIGFPEENMCQGNVCSAVSETTLQPLFGVNHTTDIQNLATPDIRVPQDRELASSASVIARDFVTEVSPAPEASTSKYSASISSSETLQRFGAVSIYDTRNETQDSSCSALTTSVLERPLLAPGHWGGNMQLVEAQERNSQSGSLCCYSNDLQSLDILGCIKFWQPGLLHRQTKTNIAWSPS